MRHLGSLILGLVGAPILWVLTGTGWAKFNGGLTEDRAGEMFLGFVVLILAGTLLAALLLPRWSPIGPAVAGMLFLFAALWAMVDLGSLIDLMPRSFLDTPFALSVPVGALSVLLSIPMLATAAVPYRWRGGGGRVAAQYPGAAGPYGQPPFPPGGQFPPPGALTPSGAPIPPGAHLPPGGQFPPGSPAGHPPNYGPSAAPSFGPSVPPNYGPAVPPSYGPAPTHNAPPTPPYHGAPATPGHSRIPGPQAPGSPISGPPVAGPPPISAPPVPPTLAPLPAPGRPGPSAPDETTQFTGGPGPDGPGPDDDGTDGATRRLGDDTRPF